jgi:hypothetical protein
MRYIDFILKAKTVGLTLSEMRRVIEVAHDGANPLLNACRMVRLGIP